MPSNFKGPTVREVIVNSSRTQDLFSFFDYNLRTNNIKHMKENLSKRGVQNMNIIIRAFRKLQCRQNLNKKFYYRFNLLFAIYFVGFVKKKITCYSLNKRICLDGHKLGIFYIQTLSVCTKIKHV